MQAQTKTRNQLDWTAEASPNGAERRDAYKMPQCSFPRPGAWRSLQILAALCYQLIIRFVFLRRTRSEMPASDSARELVRTNFSQHGWLAQTASATLLLAHHLLDLDLDPIVEYCFSLSEP